MIQADYDTIHYSKSVCNIQGEGGKLMISLVEPVIKEKESSSFKQTQKVCATCIVTKKLQLMHNN